jgi:hypothetical protein
MTPPRSTRQQHGTFDDDRRSRQAKKLHSILGTTEQQRLENAIDSYTVSHTIVALCVRVRACVRAVLLTL